MLTHFPSLCRSHINRHPVVCKTHFFLNPSHAWQQNPFFVFPVLLCTLYACGHMHSGEPHTLNDSTRRVAPLILPRALIRVFRQLSTVRRLTATLEPKRNTSHHFWLKAHKRKKHKHTHLPTHQAPSCFLFSSPNTPVAQLYSIF